MKFALLLLSLLSFASAKADEGASAPAADTEAAPVLKCPAMPDAYSKMITDLNLLKTSIKKEAACEPLASEVQDLQALLGPKRSEVMALVEKSKTASLTASELETVRKYVEDVTKRVSNTAELFSRNNYCFLEDKKNLTLGDLASITLDATALAQMVAGPWAVPVSLGGQALAGIFQGLNNVVKSRRGYDFTKIAQRQGFVQSLCAYYNYRQDLENLLFPDQRAEQLLGLQGKLNAHLGRLEGSCPECSALVPKVISTIKEEASARGKTSSARKLTVAVEQINSTYVRPLGTYTLKALTTMSWISGEMARIREENVEGTAIGRDLLSEIKADIDRFMFETQGPAFLEFQAQKAIDLFREFSLYVQNEGNLIQSQAYILGWKKQDLVPINEAEAIRAVSAIEQRAKAVGQVGLASRVADYRRKSVELFERTRIATGVLDAYCVFFQRGGVYNSRLQDVCEGPLAGSLRRRLKRLEGNDAVPQPVLLTPSKDFARDWVDSLEKMIDAIKGDPSFFSRKPLGAPRN